SPQDGQQQEAGRSGRPEDPAAVRVRELEAEGAGGRLQRQRRHHLANRPGRLLRHCLNWVLDSTRRRRCWRWRGGFARRREKTIWARGVAIGHTLLGDGALATTSTGGAESLSDG